MLQPLELLGYLLRVFEFVANHQWQCNLFKQEAKIWQNKCFNFISGSRIWKTNTEGKVLNTIQYKKTLQEKQPTQFLDEEIPSNKRLC